MSELIDVEQWKQWMASRRGRERWQGWVEHRPALDGWAIDEVTDPRGSPRTDRMQHDLVALAQAGEGEAAVTLLVQLRPGLSRLVGAVASARGETRADATDEVRAEFYEAIYRHRLDRRPHRIAANLILDTRQRLSRASCRAGRFGLVSPESFERLPRAPSAAGPGPPDLEAAVDARSVLGAAIGRLPGSDRSRRLTAQAAWQAWILEQPHHVIAEQLGLAPAAVATRLHRLRREVRAQWDDDDLWAA